MKDERAGVEWGDMGRTVPAMWRVMLGWVSVNGSVLTRATAISSGPPVTFPATGRDTVKGREGEVKLKSRGAGSMMVALAYIDMVSGLDVTLKVSKVSRSDTGGKDEPGCGKPGNAGTAASQYSPTIKLD